MAVSSRGVGENHGDYDGDDDKNNKGGGGYDDLLPTATGSYRKKETSCI